MLVVLDTSDLLRGYNRLTLLLKDVVSRSISKSLQSTTLINCHFPFPNTDNFKQLFPSIILQKWHFSHLSKFPLLKHLDCSSRTAQKQK